MSGNAGRAAVGDSGRDPTWADGGSAHRHRGDDGPQLSRPQSVVTWDINFYPNSLFEAIAAPSDNDFNFAHTTSGTTILEPAAVSKPQSVPAMMRCGSPTALAI